MRTLQEKYNGIQEGKFSKSQFLVEARQQLPNLVTRYNGYDDAIQILKNRGMIQEVYSTEESFKDYSNDALTDMIINLSRYEGNEKEIAGVRDELARRKQSLNEGLGDKKYLDALHNSDANSIESAKKILKRKFKDLDHKNIEHLAKEWAKRSLDEAKLTKKSLTDYRYKPTNDMDKYPYEQILRGLRVELEGLGIKDVPTAEEYSKALAKVSKNLEKDSIFYTNQVAGTTNKVDLHDKMIPVDQKKLHKTSVAVKSKAEGNIDTFNGMKKAQLKEGFKKLIKKILTENLDSVNSKESIIGNNDVWYANAEEKYEEMLEVWDEEKANKLFSLYLKRIDPTLTLSDFFDIYNKVSKTKGVTEGIESIGDKEDPLENPKDPLHDYMKSKEPKEDEVENYKKEAGLEETSGTNDPKIQRLVDGINQLITQAIDSDGDPIGVIEPGGTWEEPVMYSPVEYKNGALRIVTKSPYKADSSTETILARNMEYDGIPTLRLIMRMYKKAVAKAGQEAYPQDKEDLDETATNDHFSKWRELGDEEKAGISKFVKDTGDRDQAAYEKAREERLKAQSARLDKLISGEKVDEEVEGKVLNLKQLHRLAQQAGNFGEDVKERLLSLYDAYEERVPVSKVKEVLANYDLTLQDLKDQPATFKPSREFAHLFNSSNEQDMDEAMDNTQDLVVFSINSEDLDQILHTNFGANLGYQDDRGDSLYTLPQDDFDRFMDYITSLVGDQAEDQVNIHSGSDHWGNEAEQEENLMETVSLKDLLN